MTPIVPVTFMPSSLAKLLPLKSSIIMVLLGISNASIIALASPLSILFSNKNTFSLSFMGQTIIQSGSGSHQFINLGVRGFMIRNQNHSNTKDEFLSYYLHPRSSLSKTPLMLANHTGIIDSGYRGRIMAAVRNLSPSDYVVENNVRLFQICAPALERFLVKLISVEEFEQFASTGRGTGGFGSTGI